MILGIETSCDETAAALVDEGRVLASVVSSQARLHERYGGVVPEIASRRHLELVTPVVREALERAGAPLDRVERVAVTQGPGLVGALLVGISAAKAIAWAGRLPLVPVDHLDGHVASLYLDPDPLEPPFLCLLASGGHTLLLAVREHGRSERLGTTLDDAAGEAFDKGARLLGLGYPGGAEIDRLARDGDAEAFAFPVARVPGLDFSFSGLKTALLYTVRDLGEEETERRRTDLAASYQHAVVRALARRAREAAEQTGLERLAVVGGVAANSALRAALPDARFAPLELCTDNAAMIASAARFAPAVPYPGYLDLDAYASLGGGGESSLPLARTLAGRLLPTAVLAAAVLLVAAGARAQEAPPQTSLDEAGWQGVLGVRGAVSTAQRYVVLLDHPSLADRVRGEGGQAPEAQMRAWTRTALGVQEQFLARMTAAGARLGPEFRYVRVVNGFSTRLDPTSLAMLEGDREVVGVYPVRIAYPAQFPETANVTPTTVTGLEVPGLDGTGVTIALLDTGVDPSHPYLRGSILPGIDLLNPGSGAVAQPHPTIPGRPERHATELAGIVTGSEGPDELHGVAPGSSILPIRIAGWQPNAEGGYSVYSRTDQIIAGLEAAVDPNVDGDAMDAARIALLGVVEPYASFPDGPLAQAVAAATTLDVLVVVPAGNDGRVGPSFGSVGGPSGAPDALTAAAADERSDAPTVRVHVRAGLRVLFADRLPLGGSPTETVTAEVVPVSRAAALRGTAGHFGPDGLSRIAGRAPLLPRGVLSEETIEEATSAGAVAVLVDGRLPAGAFSLDVPEGVPVVGLPDALVNEMRAMLAAGIPVVAAVGGVDVVDTDLGNRVAAFSSRGLAFGGVLKPDLLAPGVAVPTSEPSRGEEGDVRFGTVSGTSVSAAIVAASAALLAQGRPPLSAAELAGILAGSAQRERQDTDATASGAGFVNVRAAVQQEVVATPASVSFGISGPRTAELESRIRVKNISTRRVEVTIQAVNLASKGVQISIRPAELALRPGRSRTVVLRADTSDLSEQAGVAMGEIVLLVANTTQVHVPWAVAVPDLEVDLLTRVSLRTPKGRVSDVTPAVLSLVAGAVTTTPGLEVRPVETLEVRLLRSGELLGLLARRREVLPGRYTFGLTGRGPTGDRLPAGRYVVNVVARPGKGMRRHVESVPYVVR